MKTLTLSSSFDDHHEDVAFFLRHLAKIIHSDVKDAYISSLILQRDFDELRVSYIASVCYENEVDNEQ